MLSRLQKYALAAFVLLMSADLVISSYGVLFFPAFIEANALFARFVAYPLEFIAVVGVTKLLAIAGIIAATIWFNRRERAGTPWHGGDIICSTAAVGMGVMMLVLVVGNLFLV
ncbi:MAG: hypothetical protein MUE45_02425 [Methanoregulaceae archaeon]|jgi:glucan phosphoethanolaminetransferase (alkaline phosphatase superfamily)|nr:hypothetical protein [Methanoregulaceae archaeon]MCU0628336.1 hypothetical protein [Methanoregulaceae archaeon]